MKVIRLSSQAVVPTRGSSAAAGLDLYAPVSGTIEGRKRLLIPLDISIELPQGTFGQILPRSGLALKYGIQVGAGVIDQDYRGNVCVLLFNASDIDFNFQAGERIAQLVIKPYESVDVVEVESFEQSTERGNGGFGSTGK